MGRSVIRHRFLPWATSGGWRGLALLSVLCVQVAVPLTALVASEPPTRGGFQMYSGLGGITAEVVTTSGEVMEVNLDDITAEPRVELDWSSRLPAYLCDTVPDAVEVTMSRFTVPETREWSVVCAR